MSEDRVTPRSWATRYADNYGGEMTTCAVVGCTRTSNAQSMAEKAHGTILCDPEKMSVDEGNHFLQFTALKPDQRAEWLESVTTIACSCGRLYNPTHDYMCRTCRMEIDGANA